MKRNNSSPQPHLNKKQRRISDRDRLNIIESITNEVHTIGETAERFKLPESTVRSVYKTFERSGRIVQLPRGGNRHSRLEQEHLSWIKDRLLEEPDLSISDLHAEFNKKFRLQPPVSRNTIQNAVDKRIAYTLKLVHLEVEDYNSDARREQRKLWADEVWEKYGGMDGFVYLDESGFNLHIRQRYGRAARGVRPIKPVPIQRGANMSLLVALDSTGLIASEVKVRAYNGVYFARFLINKLFPKLPGPRTIIMDNCRIHKTPSVKEAFSASQHNALFLPPYTPHFNIAEWAFSCIKGHVKKKSAQRYNLAGCIRRSLQRSVTATKARGWLKEVGRNFQVARANMPLGRFMNAKQALRLMERGSDPYPEVEHNDMEGEDQVEEEEEIRELDEVWKEKEPLFESPSHSSDSSEDEATEEENGDETVLAQPDEVEDEQEVEDNEIMNDEEEGEVVVDVEEEEEEEEKLHITPPRSRYSLRSVKAL